MKWRWTRVRAMLRAMTTTITTTPLHVPAGDGERIWITGDTITIKAGAASTGGALSLLEVEAAPGEGPPPHVHEHEDEAFYVLDGEFEFVLGDERVRGGSGTFAWVPRGTVHRFSCTGEQAGRILIAFTPGGMDGFFRAARATRRRRRDRAHRGGGAPPRAARRRLGGALSARAGQRAASTSAAARSPDCTAPSMYPLQTVPVSDPAQCTTPIGARSAAPKVVHAPVGMEQP